MQINKTAAQLRKEREAIAQSIQNTRLEGEEWKKKTKEAQKEFKDIQTELEKGEAEIVKLKDRTKYAKRKTEEAEKELTELLNKQEQVKQEIKASELLLVSANKQLDKAEKELNKIKDNNAKEALKGADLLLDVCGQLQKSANNLKR